MMLLLASQTAPYGRGRFALHSLGFETLHSKMSNVQPQPTDIIVGWSTDIAILLTSLKMLTFCFVLPGLAATAAGLTSAVDPALSLSSAVVVTAVTVQVLLMSAALPSRLYAKTHTLTSTHADCDYHCCSVSVCYL